MVGGFVLCAPCFCFAGGRIFHAWRFFQGRLDMGYVSIYNEVMRKEKQMRDYEKALQRFCAELFAEQGKNAVFEFVKQNHRELSWYFCRQCESECPATSTQVCLVCGANIFDEDEPELFI